MSFKEGIIKYLHQSLFSPTKTTLLKAIQNNQLITWLGLTTTAVKQNLPTLAPSIDKGHMSRQQQGIRSTRADTQTALKNKRDINKKIQAALEEIETKWDINPPMEKEKDNQIFTFTAIIRNKDGAIYTDFTGKFLIRSGDGMTSILIIYDWITNAILAEPVRALKDETVIEAFQTKFEYLKARGFKPVFNIINNVVSKAINTCINSKEIAIQMVEPNNHRANVAERAIQTWKNHFIAGICTTHDNFPSVLWSQLVS